MTASLDAVEVLDQHLDDDPYRAGLDESLTVIGDLLQARGDPRGELIALEQGIATATHRSRSGRVAALTRWLHERPDANPLGPAFARYAVERGALRLGLRGGRVRELFIDLRRIHVKPDAAATVLSDLLTGPGAQWLVELRIRTRTHADLTLVDAALAELELASTVELICASTSTRPITRGTSKSATTTTTRPRLWLTTVAGQVTPIRAPERSDELEAAELRACAHEPMSARLRVRVGRALCSGRESRHRRSARARRPPRSVRAGVRCGPADAGSTWRTIAGSRLMTLLDLPARPRRNRKSAAIRDAVRETWLGPEHFIYPLFIHEGSDDIPIRSMPGCVALEPRGLGPRGRAGRSSWGSARSCCSPRSTRSSRARLGASPTTTRA